MKNKIVSSLPPKDVLQLTPFSYWVTLRSRKDVVEGKIYFPKKITDRLVIFEPGFPGGGSTQFEKLWLTAVLNAGYTVFLVRHSGTLVNGKFSHNYINCPERQKLAKQRCQEILGIKKSPTIDDWLIEPRTAIETLGPHFAEIYLVGHSFGPLALIFSLIDLNAEKSGLTKKIVRLISLAGAIGRARGKDDQKLKIWHDYLDTDWAKARVKIGSAEKNTDIFAAAHNKINDQIDGFPKHVDFIGVCPWGDKPGTIDDLFQPSETVEFIASLGRGYLILDKDEYSDAKSGRMAHDMENLKPQQLVKLLDKNWLPNQQITTMIK